MKFNKITSTNTVLVKSLVLVLLVFVIYSCEETDIEERNWQLVWQDEFEVNGAPDSANWNIETGATGWGNNELQNYTSKAENVIVKDGVLKITAVKSGDYYYSSARITTKDLFEQAYGRFEARIKVPWGPGIWPAFWLLGDNIDEVDWPQCGEIDIMEYRGQQPNLIHGSLHGPGYSGGSPITKSFGFDNYRFDVDYHVFAVEWGEDFVHFYVDETLYQVITREDVEERGEWVYDHPFYILLNVAVGGDYVGFPTSETPFPQTMYVDYVRIYTEIN